MFKSEDFLSTEIQISFFNESTTTAPRNASQQNAIHVELNEVAKNGLVLEVPLNACSLGHFLLLNFKIKKGGQQFVFETSVKVLNAELLDSTTQRIHTEFIRFTQTDLEKFLTYFESEQNAALDLFQKLKGHE